MPRFLTLAAAVALLATAAPAAELAAGIELGAKGVKGTVVEYDPTGVAPVTVKKAVNLGTTLMNLDGGKFRRENIARTADAVKTMLDEFGRTYGLRPDRVAVVGSSGLRASNRADLEAAIRAVTGKPLPFVTAEDEVRLTLLGLSLKGTPVAVAVDVGSGNTKGGYFDGDGKLVSFAGMPGTVALTAAARDRAKADGGTFAAAAAVAAAELVGKKLAAFAATDTGLRNRKEVTLTGGAAWAVATILYPEKVGEATVPLTAADIDTFLARLAKANGQFPAPELAQVPAALKVRASEELLAVGKVFTADNLLAGGLILKQTFAKLPLAGKAVTFNRNGLYAWILAYTLPERVISRKPPVDPAAPRPMPPAAPMPPAPPVAPMPPAAPMSYPSVLPGPCCLPAAAVAPCPPVVYAPCRSVTITVVYPCPRPMSCCPITRPTFGRR